MHPSGIAALSLVALGLVACSTASTKQHQQRMYQASRANVQLAIGYMHEGNLTLADTKLKRALEEDPEYSVAHWSYALLQWRLGQSELADRHFRKAIALDPKDPKARNNYGSFLCEIGRIEEGLQQLERAAQNPLYRERAGALANAGFCALKIPDMDRAGAYFRAALAQSPGYGPALYQLARIAFQQGNYIQARAFMQRYAQSAKPTAGSLWLSYQIERHLGHRADAERLAMQLKDNFPDSREAVHLLELERHGR